MEIGSGFSEEEQISSKGKFPFSYSSSTPSSPSSSSSHHHKLQPVVPVPQIYQHQHRQMGSWLGNKYDPEEDNNETGAAGMEVNDEEDGNRRRGLVIEKEHMFDKVVTPSDVGKLNRLVIPKQHAEKYFPLDSTTNEKGLLLNFEDRNGKAWRFRYSYWNSSQSYVMTKGWSRFVKEKKLDAGDVVSFERGVGELGRNHLYIDWRRRPEAPNHTFQQHHHQHHHNQLHFSSSSIPCSPLLIRSSTSTPVILPKDHFHHHYLSNPNKNAYYYSGLGGGGGSSCYGYGYGNYNCNMTNMVNPCCSSSSGSVFYMRPATAPTATPVVTSAAHHDHHHNHHHHHQQQQQEQQVGMVMEPMVYESVPVVQGKAAAKRLRLFGVNMVCPITEPDDEYCDKLQRPSQLSSTSSQLPLQLRVYSSTPQPPIPSTEFLRKGKSSISLDLDI